MTEMELADNKGDDRKVHNLSNLLEEWTVDKNINVTRNARELMTLEEEVLNEWATFVE